MNFAFPFLIVMLTSCQGPSTAAAVSPSVSAATSPTPVSCQLPVIVRNFDSTIGKWIPGRRGFFTYPGGVLRLVDATGVRYDATRKRWLPAGIATPDDKGYIYGDASGAVHEVTIDSGKDRLIVRGAWVPLGFVGDKLYLTEPVRGPADLLGEGNGAILGRLARTTLFGGTPTFVTQRRGEWHVSQLGAWLLDRVDGLRQAPDRLLHLDLTTGVVEPWLTGVHALMLIGFDGSGRPFVVSDGSTLKVLLLTSRTQSNPLYSGPREAGWPESPAYADSDRVWFSGFGTRGNLEAPAWLYQPATGLRPAAVVSGAQLAVAGPCR